MENNFIFTRYLYEKQEVEIALLLALMEKKIEESLFWAYELYYSGFQMELFEYFIYIYYNFYATLNPAFGIYLVIKYNEYFIEKKEVMEDRFISMTIHNFITRPFNVDVFALKQKEFKVETSTKSLEKVLDTNDYKEITDFILQLKDISVEVIEKVSSNFNNSSRKHLDIYKKYNLNYIIDWKTMLLFIVMHSYSLSNSLKMGKNIYVIVKEDDSYQTLMATPTYKTLSTLSLLNINRSSFLCLFPLKREKEDIVNAYLNHWLFYASFCPLWELRIEYYGGKRNIEKKCITFEEEDLEEEFYNAYNLEPDEQPKEIQQKSIAQIVFDEEYNWPTFLKTFGANGLIKN